MHYQIKRTQTIQATMDEVWSFMISPLNLKSMAPEYVKVKVTSNDTTQEIYAGKIITYVVHPVLGIPMKWVSEIAKFEKFKYFVDEQRSGPFKVWHHEHFFEETSDGILMTDIVTYVPPLGPIGRIANWLFIAKKLKSIFDHRAKTIAEEFTTTGSEKEFRKVINKA